MTAPTSALRLLLVGGSGAVGQQVLQLAVIDSKRRETRSGEQLALVAARLLRPLIPRHYRPVTAARIARALLEGVLQGQPGERIVESEQLQQGER